MSYKTTTIKSGNLQSIPFQHLPQLVEDAYETALLAAEQTNEEQFQEDLAQAERAYTDSHEAPSEVSFADQIAHKTVDKRKLRYIATQEAIKDVWIPRYKLNTILLSVMPQIIAWLGNKPIKWPEVSTAEGKIDALKVVRQAFDFSSDWDKGLYLFLMLDSRSVYLETQYKGDSKQYCALVPLILYAFKLNQKIKYSQWDRENLHFAVNKTLLNAMCWSGTTPSRSDLLEARTLGLTYQSGAKQGQLRNPVSTYKLFATKGGPLEGVPELVGTMLTQIWCAHPSNRTPYMILDPHNWDNMPTPLITQDIFRQPSVIARTNTSNNALDLPW